MAGRQLIMIRHGESTANVAREQAERSGAEVIEVQCRDADVPLSQLGRAQAVATGRELARLLSSQPLAVARTSPYRRARESAELALAGAGFAGTLHADERLRDRELGVLDTLTTSSGFPPPSPSCRRSSLHPRRPTQARARNPKYLNTAETPLNTKSEHLYGLIENAGALRGARWPSSSRPDALAVDVASGGMLAGIAPLGTALTGRQTGQLAAVLGPDSDRIVVATDADPAGQHAAARAYQLTGHGLDPRAAVLPDGMDPAQTAELHGPAALVERLTTAEPLDRQLVEHALDGHELIWPAAGRH